MSATLFISLIYHEQKWSEMTLSLFILFGLVMCLCFVVVVAVFLPFCVSIFLSFFLWFFLFSKQSVETADTLYSCDWQGKSNDENYKRGHARKPARFDFPCDVDVMKIIKFIIKRAQKPLILTAMKFSALALNTFTRVCSIICSICWLFALCFIVHLVFFFVHSICSFSPCHFSNTDTHYRAFEVVVVVIIIVVVCLCVFNFFFSSFFGWYSENDTRFSYFAFAFENFL